MYKSSDNAIVKEPFRYIVDKILEAISSNISPAESEYVRIEEPPKPELGDLAIPLFRLAKIRGESPEKIYETFKQMLDPMPEIDETKLLGGYMDIWIKPSELSKIVFRSIREHGDSYGIVKTETPKRYVVEYVSANPVHPLHIGSGRNAALGKALESMLRLRGHVVETRFYINDLGRQVAIMVLGYRLLGGPQPPSGVKEDHWIGFIYAATNVIIEILNLKRQLNKYKNDPDKYREILSKLDELMADASRLRDQYPEYFDKLSQKLTEIMENIDSILSELMVGYERNTDPEIVDLFRRAVNICILGFKKTLSDLGIVFDKWDYESDIAWSGNVDHIISMALKSPYIVYKQGAPALSFSEIVRDPEVRKRLKLPKTLEIPPLILMRSDMTTLYTVRDIAYSIKKFRDFNADYVINVIAAEQTLAQAQLRLSLYILGFRREAENLIHYSYEMVNLPGVRMSGRRGRYITLDEVIDSAISRVRDIISRRSSEAYSDDLVKHVAVSSIRYALASIDPDKQLVFKLEEALDLEKNSAPYLLYTYARANSILEKAGALPDLDSIDYSSADNHSKRRELLLMISKSPTILTRAIEELSPEGIASHILTLADLFNSWYQIDPVIKEKNPGVRGFKQYLVYGVKSVIGNGLKALGIEPLPKI